MMALAETVIFGRCVGMCKGSGRRRRPRRRRGGSGMQWQYQQL